MKENYRIIKFKKSLLLLSTLLLLLTLCFSCGRQEKLPEVKILFLHHSTGRVIWEGGNSSLIYKLADKISPKLAVIFKPKACLPRLFEKYNRANNSNYKISELTFPKSSPYGWNNYPYDYYNIWVKNAGINPYLEEPTLEMLAKEYQVIIFKHCFPVSNIIETLDSARVDSDVKTLQNYKLQYAALMKKLNEFPEVKFILFTGAAQVESQISVEEAERAKEFFSWVVEEWDIPEDNVYMWDFYRLETEGELFLRNEYATSVTDSHPNKSFAKKAVDLLFGRIIEVIEE